MIRAVKALSSPSPDDLFYASHSLIRFNAELKQKEPEERSKISKYFQKEFGIESVPSTEASGEFPVFEDPFLTQLRQGGYWRQKAIALRLEIAGEWEDDTSFSRDLREFLQTNPILFGSNYSNILRKALRREIKLSSEERDKLSELLGFLSTREDSSLFAGRFKNTGENTNLRSGPGTENAGKARLKKGILLYSLDKDPRSETVQSRKGNWYQVYFPELQITGWIFSHFLEEDPFSPTKAEEMALRFSQSERSLAWDFAFWNESKNPDGFHGEYVPTQKLALDGDYGLVVYKAENDKYKETCRIVEEPFRSLEFLAASLSGEETVPLFKLYAGRPGDWKSAFQIDLDRESISLNRNKYIIGSESGKRRFQLGLVSGSGSVSGSLLVGEKTVLQGVQSEEDFLSEEGTLFKLCLLQSEKRSGSNAAIFRFKFLF